MDIVLDDSVCGTFATQQEDVLHVEEKTETSAAAENEEPTEKRKRPSSSRSKRPSKKAARLAEEALQREEEAAAAAAQAMAEARQHEINLARAKRKEAEILVKDCTINLMCRDSKCESFKSGIIKAAGLK